MHLGQKALKRLDLRTAAQEALDRLAEEIGEPHRGVNIDAPVGTLVPLHCTALGKVLLAFQREPLRREILSRIDMEPFTRRTIRDVGGLEAHLETIRSVGVAFDDEEFSVGVRCVAAPVFRHDGLLAGAVGISGPSPRVSDDRISAIEEIVCREATALSRKIGWHEGSDPIACKA